MTKLFVFLATFVFVAVALGFCTIHVNINGNDYTIKVNQHESH